jgi:hypothetical protein
MVVMHFMLHDIELTIRGETLSAVVRTLVRGGVLGIREPTKLSHGIPVQELRQLMDAAGLTEVHGHEHRLAFGLLGRVYSGAFRKASNADGLECEPPDGRFQDK